MDGPCAIGRLSAAGPWIGFSRRGEEYRLAVGSDTAIRTMPTDAALLLVVAIVYFEDVLEPPPPAIEATHADLGDLVRCVAAGAEDAASRRLLAEAVDAIDDGLARDEVIGRLSAARARLSGEELDPLEVLRARAAELLAAGS